LTGSDFRWREVIKGPVVNNWVEVDGDRWEGLGKAMNADTEELLRGCGKTYLSINTNLRSIVNKAPH